MREYITCFFHIHSKHWYLYLGLLVLTPIAFFITLILSVYIVANLESNEAAHFVSALLFTTITSCLFLIPNYKVAKKTIKNKNIILIITATLWSQLMLMLPIFIAIYLFLGYFISEFNT
ncbi:hypothetical protein SAMN04487943_10146 [Gracilibacillus orientalis]|uniref:ABC-2 type transport system permease protein n=1 Tax=Gracilibacillus orientalis TaxID=334253 RepID=A0A1I4GWR8_9BACI|nr:hypothetical protein SAMN04487943_10146 [Gracilibacillus orientalis]